jgi:DNA-binding transcriptional ArsR family regulator
MNTLFKALNDPTRRQILDLLRESDLNAGEIAERFAMSKPSISHHLDLLRQAGLVESVKQGQFITYSLNTTVLDELLAWLMSIRQTDTAVPVETPSPHP